MFKLSRFHQERFVQEFKYAAVHLPRRPLVGHILVWERVHAPWAGIPGVLVAAQPQAARAGQTRFHNDGNVPTQYAASTAPTHVTDRPFPVRDVVLVPGRPSPDFSPRLRDKIWEWPGDPGTRLGVDPFMFSSNEARPHPLADHSGRQEEAVLVRG